MIRKSFSRPLALSRITTAIGLLLACSLCYTSCRKPGVAEQQPQSVKKTITARMELKMEMADVVARMPQTIMYSLGNKAKFYTDRAQWQYTDKGLLARIPTTEGRNKYIYALKPYSNPGTIDVYAVQFMPDEAYKGDTYSGKMVWLNLQDGNLYGITYKKGMVVGQMQPQQLFPTCLEQSMLERGYFYLDGDKLVVRNDDDPKVLNDVNPWCCMIKNPESQWEKLGDWLIGIFDGTIEESPYTNPDGAAGGGTGDYSNPPGSTGGDGYSDGGEGWNNNDPNDPGNNGPFGPNLPSGSLQVAYVGNSLGLNQAQRDWLEQHLSICIDVMDFLMEPHPGQTMDQSNEIAREHLLRMITDPAYLVFVNNYNQNNTGMWWMNENWLDNPINDFQLAPNQAYQQFQELKAAEKVLVATYPVQAYIIFQNSKLAQLVSEATGLPQPTNGKQDAFRHAFFQAINVRDVMPRVMPYTSATEIVTQFANAHETETPPGEELAKVMDIHNNQVGISYCWNCFSLTTADNAIRDAIMNALNVGELRYLAPLDANNMIILNQTQIIPTNQ